MILRRVRGNEWVEKPMANAIYVALITAIYAAIFIASSEFVTGYDNLLSNSWWVAFIKLQNMKFVGMTSSSENTL